MSLGSFLKKNKLKTAVVGAVIIGAAVAIPTVSGANFSASQAGHVDIKSSTLTVALTDDAGSSNTFKLNFNNLKPGEVQHQAFYVTNTGSIPAVAKLGQPITPTAFTGGSNPDLGKLTVGISGITSLQPATSVNSFGLGVVQPGETKKFVLDVGLDKSAGNEWHGVTIGANATVTLDQQ